MKRLILVRHATAVEQGPKGSDFHRRLKKRGRREAQLMAERIGALVELPDQLFSSPADRALQTAGVFAAHLGIPPGRVTLREELYGGLLPEEFLHIVQRFDDGVSSVMVFGHDPSFTEFACFMIPRFGQAIPKAGVLVMDIDRPKWKLVRPGDGRLLHFERPPARDVQKRMEEDVHDRLVVALRQGILAAARTLDVSNSREVTRLIARLSSRLARELRPFVRAGARTAAATPGGRTRARGRKARAGKTGSRRGARRTARRPRTARRRS
jgi:phosphohistidine phosphatase